MSGLLGDNPFGLSTLSSDVGDLSKTLSDPTSLLSGAQKAVTNATNQAATPATSTKTAQTGVVNEKTATPSDSTGFLSKLGEYLGDAAQIGAAGAGLYVGVKTALNGAQTAESAASRQAAANAATNTSTVPSSGTTTPVIQTSASAVPQWVYIAGVGIAALVVIGIFMNNRR